MWIFTDKVLSNVTLEILWNEITGNFKLLKIVELFVDSFLLLLRIMILFNLSFRFRLVIFKLWLTFKLTLDFDGLFIEARFVGAALKTAKGRVLSTFTERFHSFTRVHFLDSLCFEKFALEWVPRLRSLLKDLNGYPLVLEVIVLNLFPVNFGVFGGRCMDNSKL